LELSGYLYHPPPPPRPFMVARVERKLIHIEEDIQAITLLINHIHRLYTCFETVSARLDLERVREQGVVALYLVLE
jgi:hypothetical protein